MKAFRSSYWGLTCWDRPPGRAAGSKVAGVQGNLHLGALEQTALVDWGGCARSHRQTRPMSTSPLNPTAIAHGSVAVGAVGVGDHVGRDVLGHCRDQACSPMEETERWRIEVGTLPFCRPSWRCGVGSGGSAHRPQESSRIPS
jgi:hypothetical protein